LTNDKSRVGNFRQKNNSAEDGIDGTNGYFRRNSGCSAEQNFSEFLFRTLPRKRKHLGIPFRRTEIEAKSRNSLPNPSAEEKQLGIPFRETEIEANSRNSVPNHSAEEKTTQNKSAAAVSDSIQIESFCRDRKNWFPPPWLKDIFSIFRLFRSVPSFGIGSSAELGMPRNEHFLPRNKETVPSLFRGIFSERNSVPNPR
jgi:hypothetical protein